jgi:hypothetical protein
MRYFKNTNGDVHGYDETYPNDAPYIEAAITAGWIEITGNWPLPPIPPTTAELIAALEIAAQTYIDSKAQIRGYDSANSCISYLNSSSAAWAADAKAMNTWRDAVWNFCYTNQAAVLAGTTPLPTPAQLINLLPIAPW